MPKHIGEPQVKKTEQKSKQTYTDMLYMLWNICILSEYAIFSDETVKNFSRVSCRFGQSTNICLTVSGSLQDSQGGHLTSDMNELGDSGLAAPSISTVKHFTAPL